MFRFLNSPSFPLSITICICLDLTVIPSPLWNSADKDFTMLLVNSIIFRLTALYYHKKKGVKQSKRWKYDTGANTKLVSYCTRKKKERFFEGNTHLTNLMQEKNNEDDQFCCTFTTENQGQGILEKGMHFGFHSSSRSLTDACWSTSFISSLALYEDERRRPPIPLRRIMLIFWASFCWWANWRARKVVALSRRLLELCCQK